MRVTITEARFQPQWETRLRVPLTLSRLSGFFARYFPLAAIAVARRGTEVTVSAHIAVTALGIVGIGNHRYLVRGPSRIGSG